MLECIRQVVMDLGNFLLNATLEYVKQWLSVWGNLLLTAVIASAAVMQGVFAKRVYDLQKRVYDLQKAIEELRKTPLLFCRVKGSGAMAAKLGKFTSLEAQLSNLSSYGVWIEEMVVVWNGPVACDPESSRKIEAVLQAGQTETQEITSMPFHEVVPIGSGPVTIKLQVKFYYSMSAASVIGVQLSPIYAVTIDGTVITNFGISSE